MRSGHIEHFTMIAILPWRRKASIMAIGWDSGWRVVNCFHYTKVQIKVNLPAKNCIDTLLFILPTWTESWATLKLIKNIPTINAWPNQMKGFLNRWRDYVNDAKNSFQPINFSWRNLVEFSRVNFIFQSHLFDMRRAVATPYSQNRSQPTKWIQNINNLNRSNFSPLPQVALTRDSLAIFQLLLSSRSNRSIYWPKLSQKSLKWYMVSRRERLLRIATLSFHQLAKVKTLERFVGFVNLSTWVL